jgi:capsular polysaccharide biosynthesis protein
VGTVDRPSLALNRPNYFHAKAYEALFGLDVIYANKGIVKELYFLSDVTQNSHKLKRYSKLRNQLAVKLSPEDTKYTGIYIARGYSGVKRLLTNEQELIDHLVKKGFDILCPEKASPEMIVRKLWNAPLVIGVEGSAIDHAILTAGNCAGYLLLMPPNRFCVIYKGILDALNRPFGFYVCKPSPSPDSFFVDSMSDLDELIDSMREESARRTNF